MATIEKKYVYKVTRGSTYLGVLPNVVSEFSYTHNINSAGTQMEIEVADTADTSNLSVEDLQDEYGNPLQAEDGSTLTTDTSILRDKLEKNTNLVTSAQDSDWLKFNFTISDSNTLLTASDVYKIVVETQQDVLKTN